MIKKIKVKDLIRMENDLEWEINGFKFLYGPNGVGKTTLLDSVYSLIEGDNDIWMIEGEGPRSIPYSELEIEFTDPELESIKYIGNSREYSNKELKEIYEDKVENNDVNFNRWFGNMINQWFIALNRIEGRIFSKNISILDEIDSLDSEKYLEIKKMIKSNFTNYIVSEKNSTMNLNRSKVKDIYQVLYITVERMAPDLIDNYNPHLKVFKKWNKYKKVKTNKEILSDFQSQLRELLNNVGESVNKSIGELITYENFDSKNSGSIIEISEKDKERKEIYNWILKYFSVENPSKVPTKANISEKPFTYSVIDIVNNFNEDLIKSIKSMKLFINDVNDFFKASGKEIIWDDFIREPKVKDKLKSEINNISEYTFSSGERQIILIMFNIHFKNKDKRLLIIADEIEISLSPDWQDELYNKISNMKDSVELIGVTHSPFVVSEEDMKTRLGAFSDEY
ncbi:MAG: ATP-binding protein [Mycoplasmatales bacterium]|nr:ATP-binding protein [Mycoplasmatales bacterium]